MAFETKYKYSPEMRDIVVEYFAAGIPIKRMQDYAHSQGVENFPPFQTVYEWRRKYKDFAEAMESAEKDRATAFVEGAIDIVHTEPDPQRARTIADVHLKTAGKYNRQKFGEKVDINHNHKIEVHSILGDASQRLRSISDQSADLIDCEFIEVTDNSQQSESRMTDRQSVDHKQLKLFD